MKSVHFVLFSLCLLLAFACSSGNDWERIPPDSANDDYVTIDHIVFSSIAPSKMEEVIKALDKQPFLEITHKQIPEYCHECVFQKSGTPLQDCKKSDHVYLVRHLSSDYSDGVLTFYKVGTTLHSTYHPGQIFPEVVKEPYLVCLGFELTDVYPTVFRSKLF